MKTLPVSLAVFVSLFFCVSVMAGKGTDVAITPEARKAIDDALRYLAKTQNEDGSWNTPGRGKATASAALAGLAFLSDGHQAGRGRYGALVDKALDYVLASSQASGLLEYGLPSHAMYSHGFATLFLAEAWGASKRPDVRDKLKKAIELIVRTQNAEGGWRYQPKVADADISVTVCQIVALRAAANAGIAVPRETVDQAISYLGKCARSDGGFSYQAQGGSPGFARTGAGLVSLILAGAKDSPQVPKAVKYLVKNRSKDTRFYFYGQYYAAQGMHLVGGSEWREWYSFIAKALVKKQRSDGSWYANSEDKVQCTAMGVLILTIPNGYLPIYQR
ncbi:MAG: terpene cyclase/mutase family protein [Planctomycetes bacterium]|nr:terpene cyclase/mutase family protein [Planctomycetota bacterium]